MIDKNFGGVYQIASRSENSFLNYDSATFSMGSRGAKKLKEPGFRKNNARLYF
jgi:hypothetical protein